jgi:dihydroorotase
MTDNGIVGKIFYNGQLIEAGIDIQNGRIKRIGKLIRGKKVEGIILPAGIDVHVHFRDFKEKHKETIESGSLAALHGGICLVVDQPNTSPVIDSARIYETRMNLAEKRVYVDYALNIGLTRENADSIQEEIAEIKRKYHLPAIGEIFTQHSNESLQVDYSTIQTIRKKVNCNMTIHAEDPAYVSPGTPNFLFRMRDAEIVAVKRCLEIGDFHFCHISTPDAARAIASSVSTFEVAPHHLLLSTDDYKRLNGYINVNPPLRERADVESLLNNFHLCDVLASDHAPHTHDDKIDGAPGFPGVETTYPIFVSLALKGVISLRELIERIASNPARIFGFKGYGEIKEGNFANLSVFNPKNEGQVKVGQLHSLCEWTPYEGFKAIFPDMVFIRGEEILHSPYKAGIVMKKL